MKPWELDLEGRDMLGLGGMELGDGVGMSGMEEAVRLGAQKEGKTVKVIDGVRAGIVLLEGVIRAQNL